MSEQAIPISASPTHAPAVQRAALMALAFSVLWALIDAAPSTNRGMHVNVVEVIWTRYTVHLLIVLALWLRPGTPRPWDTHIHKRHLIRSLMMLIMPTAFVVGWALGGAGVMEAFWIAPLMILALAARIDHERAGFQTWLAAGLGWAGAYLYYGGFAGFPSVLTIVFALLMAASFAIYVVMTRGMRTEPFRVNMFYTAIVPWAVTTPFMLRMWTRPSLRELGIMIFIGAAGWLALAAIDRAVDAARSSLTAPLLHLQTPAIALIAVFAGRGPSQHRILASTALVGLSAVFACLGILDTPTTDIR